MNMTPTTASANTTTLAAMAPAWQMALEANFGSVMAWRDDFVRRAGSASTGQVVLAFEPPSGRLVHAGPANAGDAVSPSAAASTADGLVPLLTLELDDRSPLTERLATIDWNAVYERYQHAVHEASAGLAASAEAVATSTVFDVRRAGVFEAAKTMLPGAQWRDPAGVAVWAKELPAEAPVLVYCVYGHEVGRVSALRLKAEGVNARFLEGGIDEWAKAGRPVLTRP